MVFHGLLDNGVLYHRIDEDVHEGMRLGRHLRLDARSLAHMVENDVQAMSATPLRNQQCDRPLVILDQGTLGSCTGMAGTGALGTQPFYDKVGRNVLPPPNDDDACEQFAVQLYSDATKVDPFPGSYPPEDTGSSGLAICEVLNARGTIRGYTWARTGMVSWPYSNRGLYCRACRGMKPSSTRTATGSLTQTRTGRRAASQAAMKSKLSQSSSTPQMRSTVSSPTRIAGARAGETVGRSGCGFALMSNSTAST